MGSRRFLRNSVEDLTHVDDFTKSLQSMREVLAVPNLADRAAALLEELIISGKVKPGSRIIEETLARDLGISRTSLREAVICLEKTGLIAREGKTGRVIRAFSPKDVLESYEMWAILESEAAAMGCELADAEALAKLRQLLQDMAVASDHQTYQFANLEFHRMLTVPCPNATLREAYHECLKKIRWAWAVMIPRHARRVDTGDEHERIYDAFAARDGGRVRELVRQHHMAGRSSFLGTKAEHARPSAAH